MARGIFTVSTQVHPFKNIFEPKSSLDLKTELHEQVELLRGIAKECSIADSMMFMGDLMNMWSVFSHMKTRYTPRH